MMRIIRGESNIEGIGRRWTNEKKDIWRMEITGDILGVKLCTPTSSIRGGSHARVKDNKRNMHLPR